MARGHRIEQLNEVPLVLANSVEKLTKTRDAVALLKKFGAYDDVEKVISSKTMRAGKGKMRNRRFVQRRGPLVVYDTDNGITRAFRNIPGIELADVNSLNLLQLAPGGHLGRFCVWTQGAFEKLDTVFGTMTRPSSTRKHNGTPARLPQMQMKNSDLSRIINSDEVQSVVNAPKQGSKPRGLKCNPLKNAKAMASVNPYASAKKELEVKKQKAAEKAKADVRAAKKAGKHKPAKKDPKLSALKKSFYQSMIAD
jgi:large subunit ribosomal protein L4e